MRNTFGVISLIVGILGAILVWVFPLYTIELPIIAIIFGGIGIAKDDSKTLGIIGLIIGILGIIFAVLAFVLFAAILFGSLFDGFSFF